MAEEAKNNRKRWLVQRAEQPWSGPYSASEIREALRAGRLDPDSLVRIQGSSATRMVLEADEIFETKAYPARRLEKPDPTKIANSIAGKEGSYPRPADPSFTKMKKKGLRKQPDRKGKDTEKTFYLWARGGKHSPLLSARDIAKLYLGGRISASSLICRTKDKNKLTVAQLLPAKVLKQNRRLGEPGDPLKPARRMPRGRSAFQTPLPDYNKKQPVKGLGPGSLPQKLKSSVVMAVLFLALLVIGLKSLFKTYPELTGFSLPEAPVPQQILQLPSQPPAAVPVEEPRASPIGSLPPPAAAMLDGSKISPLSQLSGLAGNSAILGPLSFSQNDLLRCPTRCNLQMRDPAGQEVRVIFFKAAYIRQLSERYPWLWIKGSIDPDGKRFYLSRVF